jgi:hypothetical protein
MFGLGTSTATRPRSSELSLLGERLATATRFEGVICEENRHSDDWRRLLFLPGSLAWPAEGVPLLCYVQVGWEHVDAVEVGWVDRITRVGTEIRARGELTAVAPAPLLQRARVHMRPRALRSAGGGCSIDLAEIERFGERPHTYSYGRVSAVTLVTNPAFRFAQLRMVTD